MKNMSGEIISYNKIYMEWKICDFSKNIGQLNLCSPLIYFSNTTWYLKVMFHCTSFDPGFYIVLQLAEDIVESITVNFTLGIKDCMPAIKYGPQTKTFGSIKEWRHGGSISIHECKARVDNFIKEDTLTIYFEVTTNQSIVKDVGSQCSLLCSSSSLSRDFQGLFLNRKDSDVTIEVQDKVFEVHQVILKTRCPVFAAMFESNMKEKSQGVVKVEDCDPDIFGNFIQFIYTGETVGNMSYDKASSLYRVADKYGLMDLKQICAYSMEEVLSLDTVYDVFFLANMHNDIKLKKSAEKYLVENMKTALLTNKWDQFMIEHGVLAAQILKKAFQKVTS